MPNDVFMNQMFQVLITHLLLSQAVVTLITSCIIWLLSWKEKASSHRQILNGNVLAEFRLKEVIQNGSGNQRMCCLRLIPLEVKGPLSLQCDEPGTSLLLFDQSAVCCLICLEPINPQNCANNKQPKPKNPQASNNKTQIHKYKTVESFI